MTRKAFLLISILLVSSMLSFAQDTSPSPVKEPEKANKRPAEPPRKVEPWDDSDVKTMALQCVTFETEKGQIRMEMYPASAPETVRNFLNLVSIGALDTTTFSRVVPGFVIQGGNLYTNENLTNDLRWRAIRKIRDEPNQILHERGVVSMARPEEPDSATTSFFILLKKSATLDGKFAAFGRVIGGMEAVDAINKMPIDGETPKEPVRISDASVAPCVTPTAEAETAN